MKRGLIFSGQGAQAIGMGKSLYENTCEGKEYFDRAAEVLGYDIKEICFNGPEGDLTQTKICQPALYIHGYIIYRVLEQRGLIGDTDISIAMGLSLGELTALGVAGVYDFETGLKIVEKRGELMQEACERTNGGMASVIGGELNLIKELCQKFGVDISNFNANGQTVVSGEADRIREFCEYAKDAGLKKIIPLKVAGAYHSRLMESARVAFSQFLKAIEFRKPRLNVVSNVTGGLVDDPEDIKLKLVDQIVKPVRWVDCMMKAKEEGVLHFYECGPGSVLAGLAKRIDAEFKVESIGEWDQLQKLSIHVQSESLI